MKELLNEVSYIAIDTSASSIKRQALQEEITEMSVLSVAGTLTDSQRHWSLSFSDKLPTECTVAEIADSSGEWSAVAESRDDVASRYLVFSDYAGYAPVFYAFLPNRAVVLSDSFNGVIRGLYKLGHSASFNLGNYVTLISGRARTFETLISSETMANEVSILKPNEALLIEDEEVVIIDRNQLSQISDNNNYQTALRQAVEYTSQTISNYVSNNSHMTPLVTLTGGVDSRLVLAFLKSTGYLQDFRVWTMDPRNKKSPNQRKIYTIDVEIANQIRKHYGLEWMPSRKRQKFSVSLAESLARHQSFNSNYSFQFHPTQYLLLEKEPLLTLRGGGGEILRGSSGAQLAQSEYDSYLTNGGKLGQVDWAASDFLSRSLLTDPMRKVAHDFLVKQLDNKDTFSVREKLDSFYKGHRNRAHFGHHRISETRNDFILQVLSNPYMQRLVDLSSYDFVSKNGIVRDLFKGTEPQLLKFPFESDSAHRQLFKRSLRKFKYKGKDSWKTDFNALKSSSSSYDYTFPAEQGMRGEDTSVGLYDFAKTFIERGFRVVEDLAPAENRSDLAVQHEKIFSRVVNQQLPLGRLIAVVASATDVIAPMELNTARHYFTSRRRPGRIPPENILDFAARPYQELLR